MTRLLDRVPCRADDDAPVAPTSGVPTRTPLERSPSFKQLVDHARGLQATSVRSLFASDPHRFSRFLIEDDGMLLDISRNKITDKTISLLIGLARDRALEAWRDRLFAGEAVNCTENRPALHMALRAGADGVGWHGQGAGARRLAQATLARMETFTREVHRGIWRGHWGDPIQNVVHIGIGGSNLGPKMMVHALAPYARPGLKVRFASNIDGGDIQESLSRCDPRSTLFVVASKSFTTHETVANAMVARDWLTQTLGANALGKHMVAITMARDKAEAFGLGKDNVFEIWDWVGGRYSLWSAVGLPIALALGWDAFERILAGARSMDDHFRNAPLKRNMPVLMALLGVWNGNILGAHAHAILPYGYRLALLPPYLQQLDMESNGKRVTCDGTLVEGFTGPIVFGREGCNGQHSFYQSLHQGTRLISCDFVVGAQDQEAAADHHLRLVAGALAQAEALARGKTLEEAFDDLRAKGTSEEQASRLAPHMVFPGDKPQNMILLRRVDPYVMGRLAALYEHKVVAQGALWNVNSFDQMGVELGKQITSRILPDLSGDGPARGMDDDVTIGLIEAYKRLRVS